MKRKKTKTIPKPACPSHLIHRQRRHPSHRHRPARWCREGLGVKETSVVSEELAAAESAWGITSTAEEGGRRPDDQRQCNDGGTNGQRPATPVDLGGQWSIRFQHGLNGSWRRVH